MDNIVKLINHVSLACAKSRGFGMRKNAKKKSPSRMKFRVEVMLDGV